MITDVGTRYRSKNGLEGTIMEIHGVKRLIVKNKVGKTIQTITLSKLDLKIFTLVEEVKNES